MMPLFIDPVVIPNTAFELMQNGSFVRASYTPYTSLIGNWFFVILLVFLLIVTFVRTQDFAYVFIYGIFGLVALGMYGLLPQFFKATMYVILAISLMLTLYAFYARKSNG